MFINYLKILYNGFGKGLNQTEFWCTMITVTMNAMASPNMLKKMEMKDVIALYNLNGNAVVIKIGEQATNIIVDKFLETTIQNVHFGHTFNKISLN